MSILSGVPSMMATPTNAKKSKFAVGPKSIDEIQGHQVIPIVEKKSDEDKETCKIACY
jgi:hypothetical protein